MKSLRVISAVLFLSVITVSFSGCDFKPKAIGNDNELAILIDADVREAVEGRLLSTFCPIVDTPQPERRFIPVWGDYQAVNRLQTYRFILLVGTLDGQDKLSGLVQQMLSDEIVAGVRRGDYFVFQKKNEWARDQLLLILVAENSQQLTARLETNGQDLFQLFVDARNRIVHDQLYHSYEQKSIAAEIQQNYGIKLRIPHDYIIVREEPEEGWLRLKRTPPTRWLTLWRSEVLEADPIDSSWALSTWSERVLEFADSVRLNPDYVHYEPVTLKGLNGLTLSGLWETIGPQGGGPFFCHFLYNPAEKRVYMLEGEVYNPGADKEPYLKQLEVIIETFVPPGKQAGY